MAPSRKGIMCGLLSTYEKMEEPLETIDYQQAETQPENCREWKEIFKDIMPRWPPSDVKSDLTIIVENPHGFVQETFEVHKSVIHVRNRVLSQELRELPPDATEMILRTPNPMSFKYLIEYIYSEELSEVQDIELLQLVELAAEFDPFGLLTMCLNKLQKLIKIENVLQIFEKCRFFHSNQLKSVALDFILRNCDKIFKTEAFLSVEMVTLLELLPRDDLYCSELEIFEALIRWATIKIQKQSGTHEEITPALLRTELNPLIQYIRFPLISLGDIGNIVQPSNILTLVELVEVYGYVNCAPDKRKTITVFNTKPRVFGIKSSQLQYTRVQSQSVNDNDDERSGLGIQVLNRYSPTETMTIDNVSMTNGHELTSNENETLNNGQQSMTNGHELTSNENETLNNGQQSMTNCRESPEGNFVRSESDSSNRPRRCRSIISNWSSIGFSRRSQPIASTSKVTNKTDMLNHLPLSPASTELCSSPPSPTPTRNPKRPSKRKHAQPKAPRENASVSGQSDEISANENANPGLDSAIPWDQYIKRWQKPSTAKVTRKIDIPNVTKIQFHVPRVYMPLMEEFRLDLQDDTIKDSFDRFDRFFDVRKYIFFDKQKKETWKLKDLWRLTSVISIKVNGVKMLVMDKINQELTISFRGAGDAIEIMSGLKTHDHLKLLYLLKTDIPKVSKFPTLHLEQVVFYNVVASSENDLAAFIKKCPKLTVLSSWLILPSWNHKRYTTLDLQEDLVFNEELKFLALCKCNLTFTPTPKQVVKESLKELFLDLCFFPATFCANIHLMFPNLTIVSIRQRDQTPGSESEQEDPSAGKVTARLIANVSKIKTITGVRIWGMDWKERHKNYYSSPAKNSRTSIVPISNHEVQTAKTFVTNSGLREGVTNFIMKKFPDTNEWEGEEYDDNEPKNIDDGFWDMMDKHEFAFFRLKNIYKECTTFQDCFTELSIP